jgi:hypothetical protein
MKKFLFHFAFIALPFISASVLQEIEIGQIKGFQNLFWGSVFGIGWFVARHALNFVNKLHDLFGFFVWPYLVCFALYKWSAVAWNSKNIKMLGEPPRLSLRPKDLRGWPPHSPESGFRKSRRLSHSPRPQTISIRSFTDWECYRSEHCEWAFARITVPVAAIRIAPNTTPE